MVPRRVSTRSEPEREAWEPEDAAESESESESESEPETWEPEDPAPADPTPVGAAAEDRAPEPRAAMVSAPVRTRTPAVAWRSVPRWVYLAIVAVPLLALVVYNLVAASGGGSAPMGKTFTHDSGLTLGVNGLQRYATADRSAVAPGEQAYQVVVAVNNKTSDVIPASAVAVSALVNGAPAAVVPLDRPLDQDVAPGVQLNIPFRFKVKSGTTGAVQISVETPSEKPVYFTGTL